MKNLAIVTIVFQTIFNLVFKTQFECVTLPLGFGGHSIDWSRYLKEDCAIGQSQELEVQSLRRQMN
jgi:hypothetical protein